MTTIEQLGRSLRRRLRAAGVEADAFEADVLLTDCLGLTRARRLAERDTPVERLCTPAQCALLEQAAARRERGEPLQYVVGSWEFYGLPFALGPGVLIPRPDTETLVDTALRLLGRADTGAPVVYDLCAGSGCVAVAVAVHAPQATVTAFEWSEAAFAFLQRNIERNGAQVRAVRLDVLSSALNGLPPADFVLSNPPYIPTGELVGLSREVRAEPLLALDGGEDGLRFYRRYAEAAHTLLRPGGWLVLEVGLGQADAVLRLLDAAGLRDTHCVSDAGGVERVVCGRL